MLSKARYVCNGLCDRQIIIATSQFISYTYLIKRKVEVLIMGFFAYIIVGGFAGWIASIIMNRNAQMGIVANIVVGIIGANIGGFVMNFFGKRGVTGINFHSIIVSVIGSVILLYIVGLISRRR